MRYSLLKIYCTSDFICMISESLSPLHTHRSTRATSHLTHIPHTDHVPLHPAHTSLPSHTHYTNTLHVTPPPPPTPHTPPHPSTHTHTLHGVSFRVAASALSAAMLCCEAPTSHHWLNPLGAHRPPNASWGGCVFHMKSRGNTQYINYLDRFYGD